MKSVLLKATALSIAAIAHCTYSGEVWHMAMDDVSSMPVSMISHLLIVDNSNVMEAVGQEGEVLLRGCNATFRMEEAASAEPILPDPRMIVASDRIKVYGAEPDAYVLICDVKGQLLGQYKPTQRLVEIDIANLQPDVYILRVNGASTKFIKKN